MDPSQDELADTLVSVDERSTASTQQAPFQDPFLTGKRDELLWNLRHFLDVVAPWCVAADRDRLPLHWTDLVKLEDHAPMLSTAVDALRVCHHIRYSRLDGQERSAAETHARSLQDAAYIMFVAMYRQFTESYRLSIPNRSAGALHTILATGFLLVLLAVAKSQRENYRILLQSYAQLLHDRGGTLAMIGSCRLRAQTAVLVRFDITLALVNKKKCCIPVIYLEALANCGEDPWEFFTMTGWCSYRHMLIAYEMCNLVAQAQYESSATVKRSAVILEDQLQDLEPSPPKAYAYPRIFDDGRRAEEIKQDRTSKMLVGFTIWSNTLKYYSRRVLRCLGSSDPSVVEPRDQVLAYTNGSSLHGDIDSNKYLLPVLLVAADVEEDGPRDMALKYILKWRGRVILPHWDSALLHSMWRKREAYPELDQHFVSFCDGADHMFV